MKNRKNSLKAEMEDPIRDAWENLGVAFEFNISGIKHADPEHTILQSLKEFHSNRKMLKLILAWLKEYGDLVHVERLKALLDPLTAVELAWLGGLSSYMLDSGDSRWKIIVQKVEAKLGVPKAIFPLSRLDELQAKRLGEDPHFKKFGLIIPNAEPADSKKLRPFAAGIRGNLWLRMRVLFGVNWRADMAVILLLGLAKNPYQAELLLGCSKETAYRNWKALKEAEVESLLKGAA